MKQTIKNSKDSFPKSGGAGKLSKLYTHIGTANCIYGSGQSFSWKFPVLYNTYSIQAWMKALNPQSQGVPNHEATDFCQWWVCQLDPESCDTLWVFYFSQQVSERSGQVQFLSFSQSCECFGCYLAQWSWTDCFGGFRGLSSCREANVA